MHWSHDKSSEARKLSENNQKKSKKDYVWIPLLCFAALFIGGMSYEYFDIMNKGGFVPMANPPPIIHDNGNNPIQQSPIKLSGWSAGKPINKTNMCTYWSSIVENNAEKASYDKNADMMTKMAIPIANQYCDPSYQKQFPFEFLFGNSYDNLYPDLNIDVNETMFERHHGSVIQTKCCEYMLSSDGKTWVDLIFTNKTEIYSGILNQTEFEKQYAKMQELMK